MQVKKHAKCNLHKRLTVCARIAQIKCDYYTNFTPELLRHLALMCHLLFIFTISCPIYLLIKHEKKKQKTVRNGKCMSLFKTSYTQARSRLHQVISDEF